VAAWPGESVAMDSHVLLEWVNFLGVSDKPICNFSELRDGEVLLRVMQDLSPQDFAGQDGSSPLADLLHGLVAHSQGRRGRGAKCAQILLDGADSNQKPLDVAELLQLVIWAAIDNDLPSRQHYVEVCQGLSVECQEAVREAVERFGGSDGSPMQLPASPELRRLTLGSPMQPPSSPNCVD